MPTSYAGISMFAISTILIAVSPILFAILSFIFWTILRIVKYKIFAQTWLRNAVMTSFTMLYLAYPSIIAFSL